MNTPDSVTRSRNTPSSSDEAAAVARLAQAMAELNSVHGGWTLKNGRNRDIFGPLHGKFHQRKSSGPCQRRNCKKRAISRSHVLARGAALDPIAEGDKVVGVDLRATPSKTDLIGILKASTFPGYCTEHELEFKDFENAKKFNSWQDLALQSMRSTARELWMATNDATWMRECAKAYRDSLARSVLSESDKAGWTTRLAGSADLLASYAEQKTSQLQEIMHGLERSIDDDRRPAILATRLIDRTADVIFSGSTRLHGLRADPNDGELVGATEVIVVTMVPDSGGTRFIIAGRDPDLVNEYAETVFVESKFDAVVIEWMGATDHWFVRPSAWRRTEPTFRKRILAALATI